MNSRSIRMCVRSICLMLIISFVAYDIAWAYPDKLQIPLRTADSEFKPEFIAQYDLTKKSGSLDSTGEPQGAPLDPQKLIGAIPYGAAGAIIHAVLSFYTYSHLNTLIFWAYIIGAVIMPLVLKQYVEEALSFIRHMRPHGLISVLESANNIHDIQDHDPDSRGKIAYYSYAIEHNLGLAHGEALYVDKEALRRVPKLVQAYIYLHDAVLHGLLRVRTELIAVPLTFSIPIFLSAELFYIFFGIIFGTPDYYLRSLYLFVAYNILLVPILKIASSAIGKKKTPAGHYLVTGPASRFRIDNNAIDEILQEAASARTGDAIYWRDWLRGGDGSPTVEYIQCEGFYEDLIVVKSLYSPMIPSHLTDLEDAIRKAVLWSGHRPHIELVIADDGPSVLTAEERKARVENIVRNASSVLEGHSMWSKILKVDLRSTRYDLTRLRELRAFYRRRLDRIEHANVRYEAVACDVHDATERLANLFGWAEEKGIRRLIFTGDYLGRKKGLDSIDQITRHKRLGHDLKLTMLLGMSEHMFLRAMLGDKKVCTRWPAIMEGPAVIDSLKKLETRSADDRIPAFEVEDIKKAREFRTILENIIKRRREEVTEKAIDLERTKWYMFHPKLLDVVEGFVEDESFRFVYYEDDHHNLYLVGSVPRNFSWRGLKGMEGFRAMEDEFRECARGALRLRKITRDIWMIMNRAEAVTTAAIDEIIKRVEHEIDINRGLKRALVDESALEGIKAILELLKGDVKSDALAVTEQGFDSVLAGLMDAMSGVAEKLPEVFEVVFRAEDSPFRSDIGRSVKTYGTGVEQSRRLLIGINTVITPDDFTKETQALGQVRFTDRDGSVRLMNVDSLSKAGGETSQLVLSARTIDETQNTNSMESVIRRKLESVEAVLNDYEDLLEIAPKITRGADPYAGINTVDSLSQYIDELEKGVSNVKREDKVYGLQFLRPLFRLLLRRLREDFDGAEEFADHCDRVIKRNGSRALIALMNGPDPELLNKFKKIRNCERTKHASISFYVLLLSNLVPSSTVWFEHLYDQFMIDNPAEQISFARKGISYHTRADSIVHFYNKSIIYGEDDSIYLRSLDPVLGEERPAMKRLQDPDKSDNADKVLRALTIWMGQAHKPGYEHLKKRIRNFMDTTTIIQLYTPTKLLFSDPEHNVVRMIAAGRTRHVLYIPTPYLDSLNMRSDEDMKELAMLLILGQRFIDLQEELSARSADFEETQKAISAMNTSFFNTVENGGDDSGLVDLPALKKKLSATMRSDNLAEYENTLKMLRLAEEDGAKTLRMADEQKDPEKYTETRGIFGRLFFEYERLGMLSKSDEAYNNMKRSARGIQRYAFWRPGIMAQRELVFIALRFGRWNDFVKELTVLLTGEGYPADIEEYKANVRRFIEPPPGSRRNFRNDLNHALAAQANAASPEMRPVIENAKRQVERLLTEFFGEAHKFVPRRTGDSFIQQGRTSMIEFESRIGNLPEVGRVYRNRMCGLLEQVLEKANLDDHDRTALNTQLTKLRDSRIAIYDCDYIVKGENDFFFGYNDVLNSRIFISTKFISMLGSRAPPIPSTLSDEYLLHELICPFVGHYKAIRIQQTLFQDHYPDAARLKNQTNDKPYKGKLGAELRAAIDFECLKIGNYTHKYFINTIDRLQGRIIADKTGERFIIRIRPVPPANFMRLAACRLTDDREVGHFDVSTRDGFVEGRWLVAEKDVDGTDYRKRELATAITTALREEFPANMILKVEIREANTLKDLVSGKPLLDTVMGKISDHAGWKFTATYYDRDGGRYEGEAFTNAIYDDHALDKGGLEYGKVLFTLSPRHERSAAASLSDNVLTSDVVADGLIQQGEESQKEFQAKLEKLPDVKDGYRQRMRNLLELVLEKAELDDGERTALIVQLNKIKDGRIRIYDCDYIVKDKDDFFFGYNDVLNSRIFISEKFISIIARRDSSLRIGTLFDEYILHELICPFVGHYKAIRIQQTLFQDHYPDAARLKSQTKDNPYKGRLGAELRAAIDFEYLKISGRVHKYFVRTIDRLQNKIVKDREDEKFIIRIRPLDTGNDNIKIGLCRLSDDAEVAYFKLHTEDKFVQGGLLKTENIIGGVEYRGRWLATTLMRILREEFPKNKRLVLSPIEEIGTLEALLRGVPIYGTRIGEICSYAGWDIAEAVYYDRQGSPHVKDFVSAVKEDQIDRKDEKLQYGNISLTLSVPRPGKKTLMPLRAKAPEPVTKSDAGQLLLFDTTPGSHLTGLITVMHELTVKCTALRQQKGTQILISENLLSEPDKAHLAGLLGEDSIVRILLAEDVKREVYRAADASRKTIGCIISKKEYEDAELWHGKGNEKASLLILNEDLQAERYAYLEGVIGLVMAMMDEDKESVEKYIKTMFIKHGNVSAGDSDLVELLIRDPLEFTNYMRFKRIQPFEGQELPKEYKIMIEENLTKA